MKNILQKLKSVKQFKEKEKIVLLRVDYNVDVEGGNVLNDMRIKASIPTIEHLLSLGSKIIIFSHRGRPGGRTNKELSLESPAQHLADLLDRKFVKIDSTPPSFPDYAIPHLFFLTSDLRSIKRESLEKLRPGEVVFAENIRFYPEEEKSDQKFAKHLSSLGDIYVSDAFSVYHHASVSVSMLPALMPSFTGIRVLSEIKAMDFVLNANQKPLTLVAGGAKVKDKINMLKALLPKTDHLLLGGAMANMFLLIKGYEVGDSLIDPSSLTEIKDIYRNHKDKIELPVDVVVGRPRERGASTKAITGVKPGEKILDIGPKTILNFSEFIKKSNSIIWNGPLGLFEEKPFSHGTKSLARLMASRAKGKAFVLTGGGETIESLHKVEMSEYIDFISTGGGAMLSYLSGEDMPGLKALT